MKQPTSPRPPVKVPLSSAGSLTGLAEGGPAAETAEAPIPPELAGIDTPTHRKLLEVALAISTGLIPESALDLFGEATAAKLRRLGAALRELLPSTASPQAYGSAVGRELEVLQAECGLAAARFKRT